MNLFVKLFTAARGSMREAAECAVDANALRIFEQEIYECESAIQGVKRDLTGVVAEKLRVQREMGALESALEEKEAEAVKVMQAGKESLIREVAELIAEKERVLADQRKKCSQLEEYETRLQKTLRAVIRKMEDYRRELRMAKATASHQRAFRRLAANSDTIGCRFTDIQDSLERIRQNQQDFADQFEAAEQVNRNLSDKGLEDSIHAAVGLDSVESVLKRIREKAAKQSEDGG